MSNNSSAKVTQPDVSGVALTYAKALLGAAKTSGSLEEVRTELTSFVTEVWQRVPNLASVLNSGLISSEDKSAVISKALNGKISQTFQNFLLVVGNHDRLGILPAIAQGLDQLIDQERGVLRVSATTAEALDSNQLSSLQRQLQLALGGIPQIENSIDPKIIGGFVLRVGDKVYDASISAQLERTRQSMITRSVHEIQSRRDRFSTTEGN